MATKRSQRKLIVVNSTVLDNMNAEEFTTLLRCSYPGEHPNSFRRTVRKDNVLQTIRIEANYPWIPEDGDEQFVRSSLTSCRRLIRAAATFYNGEPHYDFVEISRGGRKEMGQVRLIYEHPFPITSAQRRLSVWILVRLQEAIPTRPRPRGDDQPLCATDASDNFETQADASRCSEKITELFDRHGCHTMKWAIGSDDRYTHATVPVNDIIRPVYVVPDFRFPMYLEPGCKVWEYMESDQDDFRRERGSSIDASRKKRERFLVNPFMPWTSPSI